MLRGWPQARKLSRALSICAALVLAFVVLLDVTQAGRSYVYCSAMQVVMDHGCCQQHRAASSMPELSVSRPECCHSRVVPLLEAWTAPARSVVPAAPSLPMLARQLVPPLLAAEFSPRFSHVSSRNGPARSRELALLMVFRI